MFIAYIFALLSSFFQITFDIIDDIVIISAIQIEVRRKIRTPANQTAAANSDSHNILRKYISIKSTKKIDRIQITQARVMVLICFVIFQVVNFAIKIH